MLDMTNYNPAPRCTRPLLVTAGLLASGLGILGIFLPLLPTTPLLLLAAACFAHSSEKCYAWLTDHPRLGRYIKDFTEHRIIPRKAKAWSLTAMWTMMGLSACCFIDSTICRAAMLLIAAGTTAYILSFPDTPAA